jgi:hypothetical protein
MMRRSHFVVKSGSVDSFSGCTIHRRACEITKGLNEIDLRARKKVEMLVLLESATRWTVARGMARPRFYNVDSDGKIKIVMPANYLYMYSFLDLEKVILNDDAFELENTTTVPRLMAKRMR